MLGLLVVLCCVLFVLYTAWRYLWLIWPSKDKLPEPAAWPLLGHLPYVWNKDHEIAKWTIGKQVKDKIFKIRLLHVPESAIVKSAAYANSLLSQPTLFGRAYKLESALPPAAGSVLDTELADHHWQRMILARAFTPDNLQKYMPVFLSYSKKVCQIMNDALYPGHQGTLEVQSYMADMTLDIIGDCAFGYKFNCTATALHGDASESRVRDAFRFITEFQGKYENAVLVALFPFLRWMPFGPAKAFRQSSKIMDETIASILKQRKEDIERGNVTAAQERSILSILLRARASDARMTDKLLAANIFVFIFAGHETTASTLTWLMYLLAHNPKCQDKIREEIEHVLPNGCEVSYESAGKLHYINSCIKETLRFYFPADGLGREAKERAHFGEHAVPRGKLVSVWLQFVHMDEKIYPNPLEFKPERWLDAGAEPVPGGFLGFGMGPHECIGKRFAILEMKTFVVDLMRRFRLAPDTNFKNFRTEMVITRKVHPPVSLKLIRLDG